MGSGFLIVPALVMIAGREVKTAVGTSAAIIALNSAAGLFEQSQPCVAWEAGRSIARLLLLIVVGLVIGGAQLAA